MYHNFFIHSSVDGHIVCFHGLAIVNSAAMNNGIHVSLSLLAFSGYMPRSEIVGLYDGFISSFLRNLHTFFHSDCHTRPTFIVCRLFHGHSDWCEVISHCSFDLHFCNNE